MVQHTHFTVPIIIYLVYNINWSIKVNHSSFAHFAFVIQPYLLTHIAADHSRQSNNHPTGLVGESSDIELGPDSVGTHTRQLIFLQLISNSHLLDDYILDHSYFSHLEFSHQLFYHMY
jgi:hypothetical protein